MANTQKLKNLEDEERRRKFAPFHDSILQHRRNVILLHRLIAEGQHETNTVLGPIWPNSCRWLLSCKASLHALTPTHDSLERAAALGASQGKHAYFGFAHAVPSTSSYNCENLTDPTNIVLFQVVAGFQLPRKVCIMFNQPAYDELDIKRAIVHEVQHDADHHGRDVYSRYSTEFRARWLDGCDGFSRTLGEFSGESSRQLFASECQRAIYRDLYKDRASHPEVNRALDESPFFFQFIEQMRIPVGINLRNSPEIDDLYLIFSTKPFVRSAADAALRAVPPQDLAAIAEPGMREEWSKLVAQLPDSDKMYFAGKLGVPIEIGKPVKVAS